MAAAATSKNMSSSTKKIEEAIKLIAEKKESIRKSFDSVVSHSSCLADFKLQWKDLEHRFSAMEKSIGESFKALQEIDQASDSDHDDEEEEVVTPAVAGPIPRPELVSFCANMDAKGLRSFINNNRVDFAAISEEFALAIRLASDPALLLLDAIGDVNREDRELQITRRFCAVLLEKLHLVSPNISPTVRAKAKNLAVVWKSEIINDSGDLASAEALAFLQLIASYNLVSDFPLDDVLNLFISISRRKLAVGLIRSLGLIDKMPDLIQKLCSKGRHPEAVKFVYALDLVDKFPPVPLLKAHITDTNKMAQEAQNMANNSLQAQNEATAKRRAALQSVLKAIKEYKLESEYPCENLVKRIAQLQHKKANRKRTATAASNYKPPPLHQQLSKRPRPSSVDSEAMIAAHTYPSLTETHLLADRVPYMGVAGPYGLGAPGSVYNQGDPNLSGGAMGMAGQYGLGATGSGYNQGDPNLSGGAMGVAGQYGLGATGSGYNQGDPNLSGGAVGVAGPYDLGAHGSVYNQGDPNLSGGAIGVAGQYGLGANGSVYNQGDPNLSGSAMGVAGPYGLGATGSGYNQGDPNLSGGAMGVAGPYGLGAAGSGYNREGPNLSGSAIAAMHSPPRSYYSLESLAGTSSSMYDRRVPYDGYTLAGLPSSDGPSQYP